MLEEKTNLAAIDRKLSTIVALLLKIANADSNPTLKEQVAYLSAFGLNYTEIAVILRKKPPHISKELSGIKKDQ